MLVYCSTAKLTAIFQSGASIQPDKLQKIVRYFSSSPQKTPCFQLLNSWIHFFHITTFRHLIHDRDNKYTKAFDDVFRSEGINIIHTPIQAPNANAYAERFVRSLREECLDHILIINESHLRNVLNEYVDYYNLR